ncbi:hypothetical protein IW262DRAFT_1488939 [Armillaria fumosa]|nr:hypothetical protein IW262DRAFT_1488939 [Armillaria fumosa]
MPQVPVDYNALRQAYLASPPNEGIYIGNPYGLSKHNLKWLPTDDGYGHVLADTSHETPSHAILRTVLHITEDLWVYPDGKWNGSTKFTDKLADLKLNCSGTIPEAGVFRDDFQHVIRNLESIMKKTASQGSRKSGVLVPVKVGDPTDENGLKVKFQHILFKEKPEEEGGPGVRTRANTKGQSRWNIDNWPANSEKAKKELKAMRTTHIVDPLPLYDSQARPVHPELYTKSLIGATVEVRFNLCHWHINYENKDVYVAYIDKMCILPVPAKALSLPGKKIRSGYEVEPPTPPRGRVALRE